MLAYREEVFVYGEVQEVRADGEDMPASLGRGHLWRWEEVLLAISEKCLRCQGKRGLWRWGRHASGVREELLVASVAKCLWRGRESALPLALGMR